MICDNCKGKGVVFAGGNCYTCVSCGGTGKK
jgi:hypothetical protein